MTEDIPDPVPVADLMAQRGGHIYAHGEYLEYHEVERAWPVIRNPQAVASANDVRTMTLYGTAYRTTSYLFHGDDVERVADAIADGTAVLQPDWRKDTEEGREATRQLNERINRENLLGCLFWSTILLLLVGGLAWLSHID
ncbi:hypothetical protein ACWDR0_00330 [Streptomyces sp. NPDC003691]